MIILRVACDNLYMFKDFELDFTYDRKINHPLANTDVLFEGSRIKVRKNLILMGANASGKTTFGKLLCIILNFISGRPLDEKNFNIANIQYDKTKDAFFEIEFVVDKFAYLLRATFRNFNLQEETIYKHKIYKSYNITQLRKKLKSSKPIEFNADVTKMNLGFKSFAFAASKPPKFEELMGKIGFWFMFSEPIYGITAYNSEVDVEFLDKILPEIDNSVKSVKRLQVEGASTATNSYQILFNNNEPVTVVNGDLKTCGYRLSHGTFETIDFVFSLSALRNSLAAIFYIDERLSHMHPELEIYLARQAFFQKPKDAQIFFTTHDTEFFDINAPPTSYILFKRRADGFNEALCVSDKITKNDRNLRNYYENDYFGILPDYTKLDEIFESRIVPNE